MIQSELAEGLVGKVDNLGVMWIDESGRGLLLVFVMFVGNFLFVFAYLSSGHRDLRYFSQSTKTCETFRVTYIPAPCLRDHTEVGPVPIRAKCFITHRRFAQSSMATLPTPIIERRMIIGQKFSTRSSEQTEFEGICTLLVLA